MAIIITIEGTDGSGKQTQCERISKNLEELGFNVKKLSFPMYDNDSSHFVKNYLNGKYGDISSNKINAYCGSVFYACDRIISYLTDWESEYEKYDFIIIDRYVESNLIHQGAKIKSKYELINYINWEIDFEYNKLKLPHPDITLFLDMLPDASEFLRNDRKNKITNKDKQDIHESDKQFQINSYKMACKISKICKWNKINCTNSNSIKSIKDIKTIDEITRLCMKEIYSNKKVKILLKKKGVN